MERVVDELFSRKIFIEAEDIFLTSTELGNIIEGLGARRIENVFETDGPRKRTSLVYTLVKLMDRLSRLKMVFDIKADSMLNILTLTISASFETKTDPEAGFFTKTFQNFYSSSISNVLRRMAVEQMKGVWKQIEYQIKLRFKYSYA